MNLITLQSTDMLRVQIAHNIGTLLYWFHIGDECLSGAGRHPGNSRMATCGSQVKLISNWILLSCNLSLYYEIKLLTTTIHFFISFMSEGWLRAGEPSELMIIDYDGSTLGCKAFCWIWLSCSLLLYCSFELLTTVTHCYIGFMGRGDCLLDVS